MKNKIVFIVFLLLTSFSLVSKVKAAEIEPTTQKTFHPPQTEAERTLDFLLRNDAELNNNKIDFRQCFFEWYGKHDRNTLKLCPSYFSRQLMEKVKQDIDRDFKLCVKKLKPKYPKDYKDECTYEVVIGQYPLLYGSDVSGIGYKYYTHIQTQDSAYIEFDWLEFKESKVTNQIHAKMTLDKKNNRWKFDIIDKIAADL